MDKDQKHAEAWEALEAALRLRGAKHRTEKELKFLDRVSATPVLHVSFDDGYRHKPQMISLDPVDAVGVVETVRENLHARLDRLGEELEHLLAYYGKEVS